MTKKEVMLINEIISNASITNTTLFDNDNKEILKSMNKLLGRLNLYVKEPYYKIESIVVKDSNGQLHSVYQFVREY